MRKGLQEFPSMARKLQPHRASRITRVAGLKIEKGLSELVKERSEPEYGFKIGFWIGL